MQSFMHRAYRKHKGVQVGVWMARVEERSNANPEPRSAIRADEAEQR